jgi:putative ABC transport system permease protein
VSEIYHNKIRTFLTLIGIIIGIAAVIIIIFVIQGAEEYLFHELGSIVPLDLIEIYGRWDPDTQRRLGYISFEDLDYLKEKLGDQIRAVTPVYYFYGDLQKKGHNYECEIIATTEEYQEFYYLNITEGRFISNTDNENFNQVIVLGRDTAEELFAGEEAIGKKITLYDTTFTVIGILPETYKSPIASGGSTGDDNRAFIPLKVVERIFGIHNEFYLWMRATGTETVSSTQQRVLELLDERHGLAPDGESRYYAYNFAEDMEMIRIIKTVLMVLLSGVASITLLVAGIGVMNIMLVIIAERIKEIGLRKALGATRRDILSQFIIESIILCIFGGILGVLLGYFGSRTILSFVRDFVRVEIAVPFWAVILSLGFTTAVGLFFGIYPAMKAAKLDPIEALHHQ